MPFTKLFNLSRKTLASESHWFSQCQGKADTPRYERFYPASSGTPGLWAPRPGGIETWWQVKGANLSGNEPFGNVCIGKSVL